MSYDRLAARLCDAAAPSVTTLPDGSVDRFRSVRAGADTVDTRASFGRELLAGDRDAFALETRAVEPGGQAVNVAEQAHALGADVTLYGHLDDPVFEGLPFAARSMGRPADVDVLEFDDGAVMLADDSGDVADWTLADLRAATPLDAALAVDGVCWTNWNSTPNATAAMRTVADRDLDGGALVCDPGGIVGAEPDSLGELCDALSVLAEDFEVHLSADCDEIRAFAAALALDADDDDERVTALREEVGATVVEHGPARAVAATEAGVVSVETVRAEDPARTTGGGDRFSAGLTYAAALGWDAELALACANACSSRYVHTGETGTAAELTAFVERET